MGRNSRYHALKTHAPKDQSIWGTPKDTGPGAGARRAAVREYRQKKEREIKSKIRATKAEILEDWDFLTVYGAWDEETPNGTTNGLCDSPMDEERRGFMREFRKKAAEFGVELPPKEPVGGVGE